jgi:hypothetical protein
MVLGVLVKHVCAAKISIFRESDKKSEEFLIITLRETSPNIKNILKGMPPQNR